MELTINAASLDTGNRRRDEHLRSADFFDTERHPEVHFVSSQVSDAGDGRLHVEGELCAAGDRVSLKLEPTLRHVEDQIELDASTTVDQRQLGMTWSPLGMARTPTALTVHARLRPVMSATRIDRRTAHQPPGLTKPDNTINSKRGWLVLGAEPVRRELRRTA